MGRATLVNGMVAVAAGVVSDELVRTMGTYVAPFIASAVLLSVAWVAIKGSWSENYGLGGGTGGGGSGGVDALGLGGGWREALGVKRLGQAWSIVKNGIFVQ